MQVEQHACDGRPRRQLEQIDILRHGPVAAVHAAWDGECSACHVPFTPMSSENWMNAIGRDPHASEESLADHRTRARLCVATLLPFHDRKPDWDGFVAG